MLRGWSELDAAVDVSESEEPPEQLLKPSEHGLGHLLNPVDVDSDSRDWIAGSWKLLLRADPWLPLGGPAWLERPAVAQSTVTSPFLLRLFRDLNEGRAYAEQIKPFNFLVTAFVPRPERPSDDRHMVLVAPFECDPERWLEMPWWNRYSGRTYRLSRESFGGFVRPGIVRPRTYRDVLVGYLAHEEAKSLAPQGALSKADTAGPLARRLVRVKTVSHVGKESNRLEDRQAGLVEDHSEVVNAYDDFYSRVFAPHVLRVLRRLGVRETARRSGASLGATSAALAGKSRPRERHMRSLFDVAVAHACADLHRNGMPAHGDPVSIIRQYLDS